MGRRRQDWDTRKYDWVDTRTTPPTPKFSFQVWHGGKWNNPVINGAAAIFDTAEERDDARHDFHHCPDRKVVPV